MIALLIIYLIGACITAYVLTMECGWVPGTPRWKRVAITVLAVTCWPTVWIVALLAAIDAIGVPKR